MKKDISIFSKYGPARSYDVVIGTHSGIFHADEVVAISLLHLYYQDESIAIVRTRDSKELLKCDLLVDIGGGELDHHQPGGNGSRQNGVKYASAGLVWKKYGDKIVLDKSLYEEEEWVILQSNDPELSIHGLCETYGLVPLQKFKTSVMPEYIESLRF